MSTIGLDLILEKLFKLHLNNMKYKGLFTETIVFLNIEDIKKISNYDRLKADQFLEKNKNYFDGIKVKASRFDDGLIKFELDRNSCITSSKLIDLYLDVVDRLESEANLTGNFNKLGINS